MADLASLYLIAHAAVEAGGDHGAEQAGPALAGFAGPTFIVAAAMTVLILIAIGLKVPAMLTSGLDSGIAEIRKQLDEAKALRAEAEALRQEYANKIANAEKDAAEMLDHARHEAEAIVAKAEADTSAVIVRREKMAADKIAAAERATLDDLRVLAAQAATAAAAKLIAVKHDAGADKKLVDQTISEI
jgi:F-type H+-transporting ATPase subunit b